MMTRRNQTHLYQKQVAECLNHKFSHVIVELLPVHEEIKACNKPLIRYEKQMKMEPLYSPACDIGIGPFSFDEGNINGIYQSIFEADEIKAFIEALQKESIGNHVNDNLSLNKDPRCFSAIEVENSTAKNVKHLLGSINNCSILSKVGIVIVYDENIKFAERLLGYIGFAKYVNKSEKSLFGNVFVIKKSAFDKILGLP